MRVMVRQGAFQPRHRLELSVLAWLAGIGRHRVVPDPLDVDTAWKAQLDDDTRDAWEDAVRESVNREGLTPARWEVAVDDVRDAAWAQPTPVLPVGVALDLLLQPYRVVLENNVNDRAFVRALASPKQRELLMDAERRAWVIFEMGGGSTIVPRVRELRRSEAARRLSSVLIDSDAMRPRTSGEATELVEGGQATAARKEASDAVHLKVLERRSIENYLPVEALRRWARGDATRARAVEAFARLTESQRRHFNVKEGFAKDRPNAARAGALYGGVPPRDLARLDGGFGKDIARLFQREVREPEVDPDAAAELQAFVDEVLERMR